MFGLRICTHCFDQRDDQISFYSFEITVFVSGLGQRLGVRNNDLATDLLCDLGQIVSALCASVYPSVRSE